MSASRNAANRDARWTALRVVAAGLLLVGCMLLFASLARAQEPEPSPTPTMMAELTTPTPMVTTGWVDTITRPIINTLGAHPWILLVFFAAVCTVTGLRAVWPVRSERPKWVAFVIGFMDLFAMNFWGLLRWLSAKSGVPIWTPKDDPPTGGGQLPDPNAIGGQKS